MTTKPFRSGEQLSCVNNPKHKTFVLIIEDPKNRIVSVQCVECNRSVRCKLISLEHR
jgi:hypothetical protein